MTADSPSSRNLTALPAPAVLWKRCIALAALDGVLCRDWESRYYSFDSTWGEGEHVASMRNGQGDDYFIGFSKAGVFVKGFDHESRMSPYQTDPPKLWPGMYDACPASHAGFRANSITPSEDATFCIVWDAANPGWKCGVTHFAEGSDPDGSEELMRLLAGPPERYASFAREYYDLDVEPIDLARAAYEHGPIDEALVQGLTEDVEDLAAALEEIGGMPYGEPFPFDG